MHVMHNKLCSITSYSPQLYIRPHVFNLETLSPTEAGLNTMVPNMEMTTTADTLSGPHTTVAGLPTTMETPITDVSGITAATDTSVFPTSEILLISESSTSKLKADTSDGPNTMAPTVDMTTPAVTSGHPTIGRDQQTTLERATTDASGPPTDHPTTMETVELVATTVFPTSEISLTSESATTKLEADTSGPPTKLTKTVQTEVETVAEEPNTMAPTVDMAIPDVSSGHPTIAKDQQTTLEGATTDASGPSVLPTSEILTASETLTVHEVDTSDPPTGTVPFGTRNLNTMGRRVEVTNDASGLPTELTVMVTTATLLATLYYYKYYY